jgi:hypothetical protein
MRIPESLGARLQPTGRHRAEPAPAQEPIRPGLPALLPGHVSERGAALRTRPQAPLLAQLVATVENLPDARARRRADPAIGIACYQAMAALKPANR